MGSRAHGLLELRHVIRRSIVRSWKELPASVTLLRGFYVSKIQAAREGISLVASAFECYTETGDVDTVN